MWCCASEKVLEKVKREYARGKMCAILNLNLSIFVEAADTDERKYLLKKERREQNEQPESMVGK